MSETLEKSYSAFGDGKKLIVSTTSLSEAITQSKQALDGGGANNVFIFDDLTGKTVDLDFHGSLEEVLARAAQYYGEDDSSEKRTGPGRPKLGVTSREVSLLPRHWDWLNAQPGGASSALRKLVDEARKKNASKDNARMVHDAAAKFMFTMAGDCPGFEEASRQYYRGDYQSFWTIIEENAWPADIKGHLRKMVDRVVEFEKRAQEEA